MNYNQNITLDLNTDNSYVVVGAKQGDTGRKITVNILQDGQPLNLSSISSNLSATYRVGQPNGGGTWASVTSISTSAAGTVVVIDLRDIDLDIPGRNIVDILLRENTAVSGEPVYRKISTVNFVLNVMAAPNIAAGAIKSEPFQYLEEIVEATETADYWADQAHMWANGKAAGADTPSATNNSKYYANQAEISKGAAQTAQALAEAAQGHAEDAAEAAEASAEAAAEIAVVGADAVLNAYLHSAASTASGEIVEFSDGAGNIPLKSMSVDIEPVQDLNGFDYPWSSNGGQNMYTMGLGEVQIGLFISPSTHKINPLDSSTYQYRSFLFRCTPNTKYVIRSGINSTICVGSFSSKPVLNSVAIQYADDKGSDTPTEVEITTDSSGTYLFMQIFADTDIPSGTTMEEYYNQALSGFFVSVYSNICPIIGWNGAQILATGANILDRDACLNGWINASGQPNTDSAWRHTPLIPIQPGMSVTLNGEYSGSTNSIMRIHGYAQDGTWISNLNSVSAAPNAHFTVSATAPNGVYAIAISFNNSTSNVMLNFGLTELPFAPFAGKTVSVNWQDEAGTVCGGTLTYNGGSTWRLVVTHLYRQFDGTEGWQNFSGSGAYNYFGIFLDLPSGAVVDDAAICSHTIDNPEIGRNNTQLGFRVWNRGSSATPAIIFRFDINQSESEFTSYLTAQAAAKTPVTVRFELAESARQTYTITADSVKSILGENRVWASCGDISELTYCVDPNIHEAETQSTITDLTTKTLNAYPTESVSGETAPTAVGADDVPLKSLVVNIALKVYGSGTPSPTNIRRFAAFGKAVISQMDGTGEWKTDADTAIVRQPQNYVGAIGDTATFTVVAIGATAYRWQFNNGSGWQNSTSSTEGYNTDTLRPVINAQRLGYLYRCRVNTAGGYLYSAPAQLVETGTTPADLSAYVDYIPDYAPLVTVDWSSIAGTICARATLDVLPGALTVDSYYKALDGTEDWVTVTGTDGNPDYYYWIAPTAATIVTTSGRYCSHFDYDGDIAAGNARIGWRYNVSNRRVMVRPGIDSIETVDDWKDYLAAQAQDGTPVQIYLAATEPRTYQLQPNEVKSLLGANTIRANAGNVDVIYRCDPTLYIDAKLSAIGG